jgi:hypothetical protein
VPEPPPPGPPPASPHCTCYEIAGTAPVPPISVDLLTQFGNEPAVPVGPPRFLCLPTVKTVGPDSFGSLQEPHLKCYDIPGSDPPHVVTLTTQFGIEPNLPVGPADLLCIPAKKKPPECTRLRFVSKTDLVWNPVSVPGAQYNLYRADVASFPSDYGGCLAPNLPGPSAPSIDVPLLPNQVFHYLATAAIPAHDGPVEGTLGFDSSGNERPNVQSCGD